MEVKFNKDWRKSEKFQNILGISLQDCINCTGQIERAVIFPKASDKPEKDENCLTFGKYRGKTLEWVQQNDPGYWQWMKENVKGFKCN